MDFQDSPLKDITPISSLWPDTYCSSSIRARVTTKSDITPFDKDGRIFLLGLLDESEEITGVVFNDLCTSFFDQIQVDNVYLFASFEVRPANKKYNILLNRPQIHFRPETVFKLCEDVPYIPRIRFNLVRLQEIRNVPELTPVDATGVCVELGPLEIRGGYPIREIVLMGPNEGRVMLNLWNQAAINFDGQYKDIILVKGTRVKEHNREMKLNFGWYSYMEINPDTKRIYAKLIK